MSSNQQHHNDEFVSKCDCEECSKRFDIWCREKKKEGKVVCEVKRKTICVYECKFTQHEVKEWGWEKEFSHHEEEIKPHHPPKDCKNCKSEDGHDHHHKINAALERAAADVDGHDESTDELYMKKCKCDRCGERRKEWCRRFEGKEKIHCVKKCRTLRVYRCRQENKTTKHYGWKREFKREWHDHKEKEECPKNCKDCKKSELQMQ